MSNDSIVRRMLEVVESYQRGDATASAVASSVELYEPALEGIPDSLRHHLHSLSAAVLSNEATDDEVRSLSLPGNRSEVHALHDALLGIAGGKI
ncbi:MAG: hypothetical protein KDA57_24220 [Planctomycetales bacterium]|nr:hypothetical protein [Planctomycetales bacterium]